MITILCALLLGPAAAALPPDVASVKARYEVTIRDPTEEIVEITLTLDGLAGEVTLAFPERYSFALLPEPRLAGTVSALGPDDAPAGRPVEIERTGPLTWRLHPHGARRVHVTWRVRLDHRRQPAVVGRDEYESPYLEADHGMLVTGALFLAPEDVELSPIHVAFALPEGWPVYAPWPAVEPGAPAAVFAPPDRHALLDDLVAVGHWDVTQRRLDGLQLTVAFAPGQDRLRAAAAQRIVPIVEAEIALFGRVPRPQYLFLFGLPTPGGMGGSPKTGSMTLFVGPDLPVDFAMNGLDHLIAHEYHHTWMRETTEPPDELRFFTEGFTDWYAHLVPWRLGFWNDGRLRQALEGKLAEFEQSQTGADRSLADAGGPGFFEGGDAYRATYAGGLVTAAICDIAIRRENDRGGLDRTGAPSLDQLMRDFCNDPRWETGRQPALEDLLDLVERDAGQAARDLVTRLVLEPGVPDLVAAFAAVGVTIDRTEQQADLSSLRANMDGVRLLDLDPAGPAGRVGLRQGDLLLEVNGLSVAAEGEVRAAWRQPVDGRIRVQLLREPDTDPQLIDVEAPVDLQYTVPVDLPTLLR